MKRLAHIGLVVFGIGLIMSIVLVALFKVDLSNVASFANSVPFVSFNEDHDNDQVLQQDFSGVSHIEIDVEVAEISVKPGSSYSVTIEYCSACGYDFSVSNQDGKLKVASNHRRSLWFININSSKSIPTVTVTVPNDSLLSQLIIESDLGTIDISDVQVGDLVLEASMGEVDIRNIIADTGKINASLGSVTIEAEFSILDLYLSMGDAKFKGVISSRLNVDNSMGATALNIMGNSNDYAVEANVSMGSLVYDGDQQSGFDQSLNVNQQASKKIKVSNSMGDVRINFFE